MKSFVEAKINEYAKAILDGSDKRDAHAMGELHFYMALRRILKGDGTIQDIGMMDAVNDTLQELRLVFEGATFLEQIQNHED
jgi:hypothetical protein